MVVFTNSAGAFVNIVAGYTADPQVGCNKTLQHPAFITLVRNETI